MSRQKNVKFTVGVLIQALAILLVLGLGNSLAPGIICGPYR